MRAQISKMKSNQRLLILIAAALACLCSSLFAEDSYISKYQGNRLYSWDGQYLSKYQGSRLFEWDGEYLSRYQGGRIFEIQGSIPLPLIALFSAGLL
jgi:hypothetical protein